MRTVHSAGNGPTVCPDGLARTAALLAAALFFAPAALPGQSVSEQVTRLANENASRYLKPVAAGLGAGLSSGLFGAAGEAGGLTVRVGVQSSGSFIPEPDDTFRPVLPGEVTYRDRTFQDPYRIPGPRTQTPTASGAGEGVVLEPTGEFRQALLQAGENPSDFRIPFPDGFDIPGVPLASLQATVGFPTGTSVTASGLPEIELSSEVGAVSSYGVGVRQRLTRFTKNPPVEVALAAAYRQLSLGDIVEASGRSLSLIVSRRVAAPLILYAGGGLEDSNVDASYTFENPESKPGQPADGTTIAFSEDGPNSTSLTAGVRVDVAIAGIRVSYTVSSYDVLRAGLSFGT